MNALKASCWSHSINNNPYSAVYDYLERAAKIGSILIEDAPLLKPQQDTYIGIDFSELYTYMFLRPSVRHIYPCSGFLYTQLPAIALPPSRRCCGIIFFPQEGKFQP